MKQPPYHLRVGKAVDRFLLIEVLRLGMSQASMINATYHGLGGPFLEDFRLLHHYFPDLSMLCIEANIHTHNRQKYHKCAKQIHLEKATVSDFLRHKYRPRNVDIFWLDYTDFSYPRIEEYVQLLQTVVPGSIVKITVNADIDDFPGEKLGDWIGDENRAELQNKYIDEFCRKYGAVLPPRIIGIADFRGAIYPLLVQEMLQIASQQALPSSSGLTFQLLHSCFYSDQTQMFSLTGTVIESSRVSCVRNKFKKWRFSNLDWAQPENIKLPMLSLKERLKLEGHIPYRKRSGKAMARILGYNIENGSVQTEKAMEQYADFSKYYPVFAKVTF